MSAVKSSTWRLLPILIWFCLDCLVPAQTASEVRGLWVVRASLCSPEAIDKLVEEASDSGFNTLLVQVRGRGDALYVSRLEPRSDLLKEQPDDFDPLDYLLEKAKARNLRVHAWINILLVHVANGQQPSPGHVLARHPEWAMVPLHFASTLYNQKARYPESLAKIGVAIKKRAEETEGFYLDPAEPLVRQFLVQVCSDLVSRYAVDGVHLDYLRYPNPDFGFGRTALDSFRQEIDKRLKPTARNRMDKAFVKNRLCYTQRYPRQWDAFRRQQVTKLLEQLQHAVRAQRPDIMLTAAVTGDSQVAFDQKSQDWKAWMEDRLLDGVCPMAYTTDTGLFKDQVAIARGFSFGGQVWAGIGAWRASIDSTLEKISMARKIRADGFLLFCYGTLSEDKPGTSSQPLERLKAFLSEE